ncbi:hypothetical protein V5O48_008461 [Marasmius crinis-equi]|uniref:Uncharacterized protein n=1 Tax=Marasmius crinis-equi TaxID=585013 RepID=A0ABR3FDZ1_9AGAR
MRPTRVQHEDITTQHTTGKLTRDHTRYTLFINVGMKDDERLEHKNVASSSKDVDVDHDTHRFSSSTGTATIFRHDRLSRESRIVEDEEVAVELPAYAKELFMEFDTDHSEVDVGSHEAEDPSFSILSSSFSYSTPRKLHDLEAYPSVSKQLGHGLLMPHPSLIVPRCVGLPLSESRPVSFIGSMSSSVSLQTPEGSRWDEGEPREREIEASPTLTLRERLRSTLPKIFGKR